MHCQFYSWMPKFKHLGPYFSKSLSTQSYTHDLFNMLKSESKLTSAASLSVQCSKKKKKTSVTVLYESRSTSARAVFDSKKI